MKIRLPVTSLLLTACLPAAAQLGAGNQPRDSFSNFDRDRDGVITQEEARRAALLNRFDQMDQNLDGVVNEREFNAMDAPGIPTTDASEANAAASEDERENVAEFRVNP